MKLFAKHAIFAALVVTLLFALLTPVSFAGTCPGSVAGTAGLTFTFGTYYYHYVDGIPDGTPTNQIDALFYYYDAQTSAVAGEYPNSVPGVANWSQWFLNAFGVWFPSGGWLEAGSPHRAGITGASTAATVTMVAYDNNLTTSDNAVQFAVFGHPKSATTIVFNYDLITDGIPSTFGGPNNCAVPVQPIPQITISGVVYGDPNATASLTWTNPGTFSYGPTGHPQYMYGYRVYYIDVATPATPPATNARASWTAVSDVEGGLWQVGDALPHVITMLQPAENHAYYFALAPIGAGNCGAKAYEDTPFLTGFVGRSSTNTLNFNPTSIDLLGFSAESVNVSALIKWETGSEVNTAGFNILRATSPDGRKMKINSSLIPATGGPGLGSVYKIQDKQVRSGDTYYYWLEEIEQNGQKLEYGSVGVTITGREPIKPLN